MMGRRTDGIHTTDDLRDRCVVGSDAAQDDGCWVWRGSRDAGGRPNLWLPALGRNVTLGVAACVLLTGRPPKPGAVWHCTCRTTDCANPWHRRAGNRSSQMLAAKLTRDAVTRARIAAGKRANSRLSDQACQDIRASTETLRVLAERHGISIAHASDIRRGKLRRPLGARGASVFNLGG